MRDRLGGTVAVSDIDLMPCRSWAHQLDDEAVGLWFPIAEPLLGAFWLVRAEARTGLRTFKAQPKAHQLALRGVGSVSLR